MTSLFATRFASRFVTSAARQTSISSQVVKPTLSVAGSRMAMSTLRPEPAQVDRLTALGTREIFDEDHDMFRDTARKFFEERVKPFHDKWEEEGQVSPECWLEAGELGLLGPACPEEYGGAGTDILYSAIVWEEQAYSLCTGPGFSLHSDIAMPYIENYGTEEQKKNYLPRMAKGECIGALGMTEPHAGSDVAAMRTTAKKVDGGYLINGSKVFITNGWMCGVLILCAKTAPEKGPHGITLFLVDGDAKGFTKGKKLKKMGMKAQDTSELFFEDLFVPDSAVLGEVNKGFYYLMGELPQERLLIADMGLAAGEAMFEITRDYLKDRKAFGKPLLDQQVLNHRMVEMKTELTVGRAFVDRCLELHKDKKLDSQMASMAKYWATDLQDKVANECVQLHGGWGYMWEYPVCRAFVDGRVQRIYGGTNEIMKALIGRSL
eukprot:Clim_evm46s7 gene=Clim_evmTU46s7